MEPVDQPAGLSPSRGQLVALFGGLVVLGLLLGIGARELTSSGDGSGLNGASPTSSPTGTADPASVQSEDDAQEVAVETTSTPATGPPDYDAIPEDATSEDGLDFGFLTRVVSKDGTVTLRFDRASFYTGDEAKRRNNGKVPDNDYLIENTNPTQRSFVLDPQASIIAANRLQNTPSGEVGRQPLTVAEFVKNSTRVLTGTTKDLPVWLRHTDGLDGDVTAVAEQYLP